jgi:pentatricopeptide repeat protein
MRLRAQFGRCDAEESFRLNALLDSLVKQGDMSAVEALMREFGVA